MEKIENNNWTNSRIKIIKECQTDGNRSFENVEGSTTRVPKQYSVSVFSDTDPKNLQVYWINIKDLLFNYDNGRLTKYMEKYLEDLNKKGETLDYQNKEQQEEVRKLLLAAKSYSSTSSGDLKQNLLDTKIQRDPAIITQDGIIWNGNRRIAIRYDLAKEDKKWEMVEAVVLPPMQMQQLQDLETRLQRQSDYKEEYGEVNECLNIRKRLTNKDWVKDWRNQTSTEEKNIKNAFPKLKTWKAITEKKKLADLLDDYLEHVLKKPKDYDQIQEAAGGLTYFENIIKLLNQVEENPIEYEGIKWELLTSAMKPKKIHKHIRLLNQAFQSDNSTLKDEFLENAKIYQKIVNNPSTTQEIKFTSNDIDESYSNLQTVASAYEKITNDPKIEFESFNDFLSDINKIQLPLTDPEFLQVLDSIIEKIEKIKPSKS